MKRNYLKLALTIVLFMNKTVFGQSPNISVQTGNDGIVGFLKSKYINNSTSATTPHPLLIDAGTIGLKVNGTELYSFSNDYATFKKKIVMNDNRIEFRGLNDMNHMIAYTSAVDGLEYRGNGGHTWKISGATEKMRLNGSGLGIGNTNPSFILDVSGRSRFRSGGGSAGYWLMNNANNQDRAFVGMSNDDDWMVYSNISGSNGSKLNVNILTGNVCIGGNSNPSYRLHVTGTGKYDDNILVVKTPTTTSPVSIANFCNAHNVIGDTWYIGMGIGNTGNTSDERVRLITQTKTTGSVFSIETASGTSNTMSEKFRISENGFVGIGTNTPTEQLQVNGNVRANSFVTSANKFPDYVFEKEYDLKTINELDEYISSNKKLPGMPSEKEVKENGLNINEVTVLSVEKIEELYLHIIELNKKIELLETKLNSIK